MAVVYFHSGSGGGGGSSESAEFAGCWSISRVLGLETVNGAARLAQPTALEIKWVNFGLQVAI